MEPLCPLASKGIWGNKKDYVNCFPERGKKKHFFRGEMWRKGWWDLFLLPITLPLNLKHWKLVFFPPWKSYTGAHFSVLRSNYVSFQKMSKS